MDTNKIKFTIKNNAFADVCSQATGNAVVGVMVAAAAGNGDKSPIESVTVGGTYDGMHFHLSGTVTFNSEWYTENHSSLDTGTLYIKDSNNTDLWGFGLDYFPEDTPIAEGGGGAWGPLPEIPEKGNYSIVLYDSNFQLTYEGTGIWTKIQ